MLNFNETMILIMIASLNFICCFLIIIDAEEYKFYCIFEMHFFNYLPSIFITIIILLMNLVILFSHFIIIFTTIIIVHFLLLSSNSFHH